MIDPTAAEVLFMGTEAETSGLEAFNAVKDKEGLNDNTTTLARTTDILIQLINDGMIEVWLGDPNSREPVYHPGDPLGCLTFTNPRQSVFNSSTVFPSTSRDSPASCAKNSIIFLSNCSSL